MQTEQALPLRCAPELVSVHLERRADGNYDVTCSHYADFTATIPKMPMDRAEKFASDMFHAFMEANHRLK